MKDLILKPQEIKLLKVLNSLNLIESKLIEKIYNKRSHFAKFVYRVRFK